MDLDSRIHTSDKWIPDSDSDMDPDPAVFVSDLPDVNTTFFCLLICEGTFTSFFIDKKSYKNQKTVGNNIFLNIFA